MPLLDHFQPPLSVRRHWESFHAYWASAIGESLNRTLPSKDYFAEVQVHVGSRVEIDVATFEQESAGERTGSSRGSVAVATAAASTRVWSPPTPTFAMPAIFPDSLEVLVISTESGPTLVAAIELISPGNKDRPEERRGFAAKCASYLQQGVGLVIIDIVTRRQANLHDELVRLLDAGDAYLRPEDTLYAVAYRPIRRPNEDKIEVWVESLAVGRSLPTLPLPLDKGQCVPLDLNATYSEACDRARIG
jgi:hypothetical protein